MGRGFVFESAMSGDPDTGCDNRWIGDADTWRIPFASTTPSIDAPDTVSLNAFQVVFHPVLGSSIEFDTLVADHLRFTYTAIWPEHETLCALQATLTAEALDQ